MIYFFSEHHLSSNLPRRYHKITKKSLFIVANRLVPGRRIDDLITQSMRIHSSLLRANRQLNAFKREINHMTAYLNQNNDTDHWDELTMCSSDVDDGLMPDHNEMFNEFCFDCDCSNFGRSEEDFKMEVLKSPGVELNTKKDFGCKYCANRMENESSFQISNMK